MIWTTVRFAEHFTATVDDRTFRVLKVQRPEHLRHKGSWELQVIRIDEDGRKHLVTVRDAKTERAAKALAESLAV